MHLSRAGEAVKFNWHYLPRRYPHVELDAFVIMPNHVHGIIVLINNDVTSVCGVGADLEKISTRETNIIAKPTPTESVTAKSTSTKPHGLPEIIRGFKTFSARRINQIRCMSDVPVWQRNYYEHIIRSEKSLQKIRGYIINNPLSWQQDKLHPDNSLPL